MQILYDGEFSADYHQIYLCDASLPDLPEDYTDEAIARRVMVGPEALIVHVDREMPAPMRVSLHIGRPVIDLDECDHAVATAFSVPSGRLVVAGLLGEVATAPQFDVPPGRLGVIVTFEALDSLSDDGLEGDDRYAVHLWPDPAAEPAVVVLKRHPI